MTSSVFFLFLNICLYACESLTVTKYNNINLDTSVWNTLAEEITSTLESPTSCASWARPELGFTAFHYDEATKTCQRAHKASCKRPTVGATTTKVKVDDLSVDYVGCFTDGDLTVDAGTVARETNPNSCIRICRKMSLPYAGLISRTGCKCGEVRPRDSVRLYETDCNLPCDGDTSRFCGGSVGQSVYYIRTTGQVFSLPMTNEDKSEWLATGSPTQNDNPNVPPANIHDGNVILHYLSHYMYKAWVQIDLRSPHRVRAVKLWGDTDERFMNFVEVRIGNLEVSSNPRPANENRICLNKLCYTSGYQTFGVHTSYIGQDCVTPLTGRYVTIQKYDTYTVSERRLRIHEVDLTLLCNQGDLDEDVCPEPVGHDDMYDCEWEKERPLTYLGCYDDGGEFSITLENSDTNSPYECGRRCQAEGKSYFGVQKINQCHCGDWPEPGPEKQSEFKCQNACPVDSKNSCGNHGRNGVYKIDDGAQVPTRTWKKNAVQKELWKATSSGSDSIPEITAIDGNTITPFKSRSDQAYPWLQIDIGSEVIVNSLRLHTEEPHQSAFNEVRVGNTEVSAGTFSTSGRRICSNRVCHTTGAAQNILTQFDCSVPLPGRFVSIQKYRQYEDDPSGGSWTWQLTLTEVDINIIQS